MPEKGGGGGGGWQRGGGGGALLELTDTLHSENLPLFFFFNATQLLTLQYKKKYNTLLQQEKLLTMGALTRLRYKYVYHLQCIGLFTIVNKLTAFRSWLQIFSNTNPLALYRKSITT